MAITKTPRLDQTRWSSGQDPVKREDFDEDAASVEANAALFKEGPLSSRPAAGVHGRFYTIVDDIDSTINGRQFYDNGTEWKVIGYTNNQLAESVGVGDTALTVRAQTSPTVDIFSVQTSAKAPAFRVTNTLYSTNQQTVGTSGGVRFGYGSSHDNAGLMVSVGATKPVLVLRGANGQTGNLLEFRAYDGSYLAQFNSGGGAVFTGDVTANSFTANTSITAPSINVSGSTNLIDATVTAGASNHVALNVRAAASQSVNLMELYNSSGTRTARFVHDGTFATSGRVIVGGGAGDEGTQNYPATSAILTVRNDINPSTPILNLRANTTQTGRMIQSFDSNSVMRFWVDAAGNVSASNNIDSGSLAVGAGSNTSPTPYFNSTVPKFEVLTGGATGAYNEAITVRHASKNSTAANRRVGIRLKMSDESNQVESNKWAGISAGSDSANAGNVGLYFYTNGSEAANFDANNNLQINGNTRLAPSKTLTFASSSSNKIFLTDVADNNVFGYQSGGTMFSRSTNFAIYSGGSYNSDSLNAGGGGITMASFTPDRTILKKLTVSNSTSYDSTAPVLQIGTASHMQFSPYSINSYDDAANNHPAEVNIANNGGRVRLGNTSSVVSLPSRILWVGNIDDAGAANAILFARSSANNFNGWVGRAAQNGDMWLDHTSNRIGMHDGEKWHIFMPDHTSTIGITG